MSFPFKWVREPRWKADCGQVLVLEMNPERILPAVSVQHAWNGCLGIVRGVKDEAGFLLEDHIREELQNDQPVDVGRTIVGADEIRKQVWSVDQHKNEFAVRYPHQEIVGWVGNGNLLSNPHFVGFAEGTLFALNSERGQLETRSYSSLVVKKSGHERVSIEPIRYRDSSGHIQIIAESGTDITEQVQYATFGQKLVTNGQPLDRQLLKQMAMEQQFYDLRHLFLFGRIPAGEKRWLDAGLAAFWDDGVLSTAAVDAALNGEAVTVDIRQFDQSAVRDAMDAKGYDQVAEPKKQGEFSIVEGHLKVVLLDGLYPHNMIGVREDHTVISVVLRGLSNRLGVSIRGAAEIMAALGASDAMLVDNGGDVMMSFADHVVLGSAEGDRNRLRSVLLFRNEQPDVPLAPKDFRLVVYPKVRA